MVCVRCGLKLGLGKLICEHCGTAVNVNESAVKNVNIKKLKTGELVYFMPEMSPADKPKVTATATIEAFSPPPAKSDTATYSPRKAETPSSNNDTRKTVFKYMSESKSRLEEIRMPHDSLKPAPAKPLEIFEEVPASNEAFYNKEESDDSDFWDKIDDVESALRDAAKNLSKDGSDSEEAGMDKPEPQITAAVTQKEADADESSEETAAPREYLYKTDYKKSPEAMTEAPDSDFELKAPLGMKPLPKEYFSLIESPKEKSMTAGEWFLTVVLLLIPGVNLIALIIWALGGCKKRQKTLFARALLIILFIVLLVSAAVYLIFVKAKLRLDFDLLNRIRDSAVGVINSISAAISGIFR